MPDGVAARETLRRLLEAEQEALEILESAEERALEAISKADERGARTVQAAHEEASVSLSTRLGEAELKAAVEAQQCMDKWEENAREIQRRAHFHLGRAVQMVVDWVIARGG